MIRALISTAVLTIVGGTFFFLGWTGYSQAKQSQKWPTVSGEVVSSKIVEVSRKKSGKVKISYKPEVVYEYEVEGKAFRNDQISLSDGSSSIRSFAEGVVEEYPPGKKVSVHFNPNDMEDSCLSTDVGWVNWLMMAVGAGTAIIGGNLALRGRLRGRPR